MKETSEKKEQQSDGNVYELAIYFARMWGVMEALEPFPNLGFERVRDIVVTLAEKFCAGKEEDFVRFFTEHAAEYKERAY